MRRFDDELLRHALISPQGVALIGASGTPGRVTARPLEFLQRNGWTGRIYPVNSSRDEIAGLKSYKRVADIPGEVDHAYILLNAEPALEAVEDCAKAGVKVVTLLADGFAEAGEEGRLRQERLVRIANEAGILLIGPNSTGIVSTATGFICTTNAAFKASEIRHGRLAVLSQSGSVIGTMLSRGQAEGIGFSALISTGNEACAGVGRLGELLLDDPGTDGFILFLETIRDRAALERFARGARSRGKPVLAYMVGRSEEGQALSASHTGALTGSARAASSFLGSIGIQQVDTFESLVPVAHALANCMIQPKRPRAVTVISTTGGGGAMVLDQIASRGVPISGLSEASRSTLSEKGIPLGHGKLVDVTLAGAQYGPMKEVVRTVSCDPATGLLLVVIGSSAQFNPELAVAPIIDARAELPDDAAPIMAFALPHAPESLSMLEAGGVRSFRSVDACAEAISILLSSPFPFGPVLQSGLPEAARDLIDGLETGIQDEVTSTMIMQALGVATPKSVLVPASVELPSDIGIEFPLVAKLVSADLPHKTEAGAIRVGIADRPDLVQALTEMRASAEAYRPGYRLRGVLLQEMCSGLGEALIGVTRDPVAGPMVTVAMGGIMTEIYQDSAVHPAPVNVATARRMIGEVKAFQLLSGYRNRPKADLDALAAAVASVSSIALAEKIGEAEINPILIKREGLGVVMLDALLNVLPPTE